MNQEKTYRAIRHDVVRKKQAENNAQVHHPDEKINQIEWVLNNLNIQKGHKILELFSGQGNLTKVYEKYGEVTVCDKKYQKTGDSYLLYHKFIYEKKKFSIIDLDPYGFPNRLFPDIFLLMDSGILFVTMPKPYVNILNGITRTHLISYYGEHNPSEDVIIEQIALWGLCHWRKVQLIDSIDCKSVWRFAFSVEKVKATDYTGVRNR
jgi:tRNA G26 N,N-dimethylase Trm1